VINLEMLHGKDISPNERVFTVQLGNRKLVSHQRVIVNDLEKVVDQILSKHDREMQKWI
jgi:hypothetical protein